MGERCFDIDTNFWRRGLSLFFFNFSNFIILFFLNFFYLNLKYLCSKLFYISYVGSKWGQDVLLSGLGWDVLLGEEVFFLLITEGVGMSFLLLLLILLNTRVVNLFFNTFRDRA